LSRLLHALQYFGHFLPFSILPAALASFHSAAHFFSRSCAASCPGVGGFFVLTRFFIRRGRRRGLRRSGLHKRRKRRGDQAGRHQNNE
jgi:hypothetical protein